MRLNSFYPVLPTDDVDAGSRFFLDHLGFRETFRSDWYVSLAHGDRPEYELAFLLGTHDSIPGPLRGVAGHVLLNLEVEDAAAEYDRLRAAGLQVLLPLRDEPWGQRHFIGTTPGGIHLDVIEVIPAAPGFAEQYASAAE
jgi:catechol 2,3-dioxygenase-like lactoylglutathione lyase family enzyme